MAYTIEQLEEIVDHEYLHYDEAMSIARQLIETMRERDEAVAENEKLRAMLKEHQWSSAVSLYSGDVDWNYCPECEGHKKLGHSPDCELDKLLKEKL